jgi:glucose-1-phosphate cytidylyltransferase
LKAVIFVGGGSTRMGGGEIPKPMVEIGGHPVVWHIMKYLNHFGIDEFILTLGYKAEVFKNYFIHRQSHSSTDILIKSNGEVVYGGRREPFDIRLVDTGLDTLTGTRLNLVKDYLCGDETFMVCYGDILSNVPVKKMSQGFFSITKSKKAIGLMTTYTAESRFGIVDLGDKEEDSEIYCVKDIAQKPKDHDLINIGFFFFKKQIFSYLDKYDNIDIEDVLKELVEEKKLFTYKHSGFYQPLDTMKELRILQNTWDEGDAPWKVW